MKSHILLTIVLFLFVSIAFSQSVTNVVTQADGKKIMISYNLNGKQGVDDYEIKLYVSTDAGTTWELVRKGLNGNIGASQKPGNNKTISWDVLADRDQLQGDRIRFMVTATYNDKGNFTESLVKQEQEFNLFKYQKSNKGQYFVAAQVIGVKVGYMSNWGVAITAGANPATGLEFAAIASLSKSIIRKKNFQWNISLGIGAADIFYVDYYDSWEYDPYTGVYEKKRESDFIFYTDFALGIGTDISIGHLYINIDAGYPYFFSGIGWRF